MRRFRFDGFTLLEVTVVITVIGILVAASASLMGRSFSAYFTGRNVLAMDAGGSLALERMSRDLRTIGYSAPLSIASGSCGSANFRFSDVGNTSISYTRTGNTIYRNAQPLADNVSSLQFQCLQEDGKTIAATSALAYYITVQFSVVAGTISAGFRDTVKPAAFR